MDEIENLCLIENPNILDKFVGYAIKAVAYGFGSLPMWPHLMSNGLKPNSHAFKLQVESYKEDDEIIYKCKNGPCKQAFEVKSNETIDSCFFASASKYANQKCLGARSLIAKVEEICKITQKPIIKYHFGEYIWKTYSQVSHEVLNISRKLVDLGFDAVNRMALFCNTSANWIMMALALTSISSPFITLYPTLSPEALQHTLELTQAYGILVDEKSFPRIAEYIKNLPNLKYIVLSRHIEDFDVLNIPDINIIDFEEFRTYDIKQEVVRNQTVNCDDMALIMFTSGSTGTPKGVMISHRNLLTTIRSVLTLKIFKKKQIYSGFLPLSHIFEFAFEIGLMVGGHSIGYCNPQTLFDTSPLVMSGSKGDIPLLRPTLMIAVPLLIERLVKGLKEKLKCQNRLKQCIFQTCYNIKVFYRRYGFKTPLIDRIVFKPIQKTLFGGRLKIGMIGGAPISRNTEEFANVCLGRFRQGYGLTETTSGVTLCRPDYVSTGTSGGVLAHAEIKLIPWEEGNYDPTDPIFPKGEIAISSPCVAMGYFNNPELTEIAFKKDDKTGKIWFHTGDIGMMTEDKCLKIIDRKKDLIKLLNGEYMSVIKIERAINDCPFVDLSCVLPSSTMDFLIALIVVNREKILGFLQESKKATLSDNVEVLLDNDEIISFLQLYLKDYIIPKLVKFEIPKKMFILKDIWTPESNMVTPTMKLKRPEISKKYSHLLR